MFPILAIVCAAAAAQAAAPGIESLGWLEGHWRTEEPRPHEVPSVTEEVWLEPVAGKMFGVGRTIRGPDTLSFEFMWIEQAKGGLVFNAQPNGAAPTAFPVVRSGPGEIVFENPRSDYPQRVTYRRDGDRLQATISHIDGTNPISWSFRRVPPR
jgi:hypothetical protein